MKKFTVMKRRPRETKKLTFTVAAIDTETLGLNGAILMTQLYCDGWSDAELFEDHREALDRIFSMPPAVLKKVIWYAHNAEYDWRYLIETIVDIGYNIRFGERAENKYYELRIETRGEKPELVTRFRDSMAIFPYGLKVFTKSMLEESSPELVKKDIGLGSGVNFDKTNPIHIEYAKNDVIGLVAAIKKFDELIYSTFGSHVKATASSTAYNAWLRCAPENEWYPRQSPSAEIFFRLGYNGGLVSLNCEYGVVYPIIQTFDINSSYPANMKEGVPKGLAVWTQGYVAGLPGFYKVKAFVPVDAVLPIVPYRSPITDQLAWARGDNGGEGFDTVVTSLEIEYCQTLGCKFEIEEGYIFPHGLCYPFNEFVGICERLRKEHKGKPLEIVVKLMQNSLYGRFGMRVEGREVVIDLDGEPDGMLPAFDPKRGNIIKNVYVKETERDTEYMLPHWAAWITANSRILIDKATELAGRENVRYRDTDSLQGPIDPLRIESMVGKDYGKLKMEKVKRNVVYHAPKCYTFTDEDGIPQATYKGIPRSEIFAPDKEYQALWPEKAALQFAKRAAIIEALASGSDPELEFMSTHSLATFMKTGKLSVKRKRKPTNPANVYGHDLENGWFKPRKV